MMKKTLYNMKDEDNPLINVIKSYENMLSCNLIIKKEMRNMVTELLLHFVLTGEVVYNMQPIYRGLYRRLSK